MQQFNVEENRRKAAQDMVNQYGLGTLLKQADIGGLQRSIESEGIAADRAQFEEERDFPYKQVQYMQSLLQGLPLAAQSYTYQQPSALTSLMNTAGGIGQLYETIFGGANSAPAVAPGSILTAGEQLDDEDAMIGDYNINTGTLGGANT